MTQQREGSPYQPGSLGKTNQPLDDEQLRIQQELAEILSLTPFESRQDRLAQGVNIAERYAQLRATLTKASPVTIAALTMQGHSHATREFDRRLDEGETFPLNHLLFRGQSLISSVFKGADQKLNLRIIAGIARSAPTASLDEVVEVFEKYTRHIDLHTIFLDVVLSYREDMDAIAKRLEERVQTKENAEILIREFDMEQRKRRAIILQEERTQTAQK